LFSAIGLGKAGLTSRCRQVCPYLRAQSTTYVCSQSEAMQNAPRQIHIVVVQGLAARLIVALRLVRRQDRMRISPILTGTCIAVIAGKTFHMNLGQVSRRKLAYGSYDSESAYQFVAVTAAQSEA
jgi:hypothetical protein